MSATTAKAIGVSELAYFYHSCCSVTKNDAVLNLVSFSQLCSVVAFAAVNAIIPKM